jgi:hypothetical protein
MKPRMVGLRCRSSSSRIDAAGEQKLINQFVGLEAGVDAVRRHSPPAPGLAQDRPVDPANEA